MIETNQTLQISCIACAKDFMEQTVMSSALIQRLDRPVSLLVSVV